MFILCKDFSWMCIFNKCNLVIHNYYWRHYSGGMDNWNIIKCNEKNVVFMNIICPILAIWQHSLVKFWFHPFFLWILLPLLDGIWFLNSSNYLAMSTIIDVFYGLSTSLTRNSQTFVTVISSPWNLSNATIKSWVDSCRSTCHRYTSVDKTLF